MAKPETTDQTQSTPNDVGWRPRPSRVPPEDRMTYEEFLAWADEDTHAEWVDGVVEMPSPVSWRHEQITNFLVTVLSTYVRIHSLGAIAGGPFQMKLASTGREPDVLFIATEHLDHVKANYLDGPADLVVEVVSPESVARDRRNKVAEYQAAGIPEYWLIDPLTGNATFYQLDARGSTSPSRPITVASITRRPCPTSDCASPGCGRIRCPTLRRRCWILTERPTARTSSSS